MRGTAFVSALLLLWPMTACQSTVPAEDQPWQRIWDTRAQRFITTTDLVDQLAAARFRLLGEVHDNANHHVLRASLITRMVTKGVHPAVAFEQFDIAHDGALASTQSRSVDAEQLAAAGELDRKSWRWPLHKPLVEAALDAKLPIRAANLGRAELLPVVRRGIGSLPDAPWRRRFDAARWTQGDEAALREDIVESHCHALPESAIPSLMLAQRVRDAAMAEALVSAATDDGAILIAGNGHTRNDLGVPLYLHARGLRDADARVVSVGFIEMAPQEARVADFPRNVLSGRGEFDYVWFTAPAEREDPCAGLQKVSR